MNELNTQVALDAGRALGDIKQAGTDGMGVIIIPEGYKAEDVESLVAEHRDAPRRHKISLSFTQHESFIAYVAEHKRDSTRIFVTNEKNCPNLIAVLDFQSKDKPSWNEHTASFACVQTEEWKRWTAQNNKDMNQRDFALFLEDNQKHVFTPSGADLLEMIRNLEGKVDVSYNSAIRLSNGKVKLAYTEDVSLKGINSQQPGAIEIPEMIEVVIPPFEGVLPYKILCKLRYRIQSGGVTFRFEMVDIHLCIKETVREILQAVEDKLGIKPFYGKIN